MLAIGAIFHRYAPIFNEFETKCFIFLSFQFAELMTRSEELFFDIRTINNIRKDMACNLLAGTSEYILQFFLLVFMLVMNFLDLLNYVHFSK